MTVYDLLVISGLKALQSPAPASTSSPLRLGNPNSRQQSLHSVIKSFETGIRAASDRLQGASLSSDPVLLQPALLELCNLHHLHAQLLIAANASECAEEAACSPPTVAVRGQGQERSTHSSSGTHSSPAMHDQQLRHSSSGGLAAVSSNEGRRRRSGSVGGTVGLPYSGPVFTPPCWQPLLSCGQLLTSSITALQLVGLGGQMVEPGILDPAISLTMLRILRVSDVESSFRKGGSSSSSRSSGNTVAVASAALAVQQAELSVALDVMRSAAVTSNWLLGERAVEEATVIAVVAARLYPELDHRRGNSSSGSGSMATSLSSVLTSASKAQMELALSLTHAGCAKMDAPAVAAWHAQVLQPYLTDASVLQVRFVIMGTTLVIGSFAASCHLPPRSEVRMAYQVAGLDSIKVKSLSNIKWCHPQLCFSRIRVDALCASVFSPWNSVLSLLSGSHFTLHCLSVFDVTSFRRSVVCFPHVFPNSSVHLFHSAGCPEHVSAGIQSLRSAGRFHKWI